MAAYLIYLPNARTQGGQICSKRDSQAAFFLCPSLEGLAEIRIDGFVLEFLEYSEN